VHPIKVSVAALLGFWAGIASPAAVDWHAPGWSHRAVVKVTAAGSAGVDVAATRLTHAGVARPDGDDYRIFDAAGRPVPYQLVYHAPRWDSLISFRCDRPGRTFYIYFGKDDAGPDPMRAIVDERPGAGAPKAGAAAGGWIPRAGLVLVTMRRPREVDNPKTVEQLERLIEQSPRLDGAGYRHNICDGFNPFGDSDYFISIYRGWIRLPRAGKYSFCTASNEASFSFMDGAKLVHWPGRHTEQRGKYGQKSAEHKLGTGLHYVEYYHEEVLLYQVAFLGYRPPGGSHCVGIPDSLFPQPHRASVGRYERNGSGRTVMPCVRLVDSVWPTERPSGQYTRYRFAADAGDAPADFAGWTIRWDFGDGQQAVEAEAEHVYLLVGDYDVKLIAAGPDGRKIERRWPLVVFPIEHLKGRFKAGTYDDYRPIVAGYDRSKLSGTALAELARFFEEAGEKAMAAQTALAVLERRDAADKDRLGAHLILASDAGKIRSAWQASGAPEAAKHLRTALELAKDPVRKMQVMARLLRHLGVARSDVQAAERLYSEAEAMVRKHGLRGHLKRAFRDATIAIGDSHLCARQLDRAEEDYRAAEALAEPIIPRTVRAAKLGEYPDRLQKLIEEGKPDQAGEVLQQWYEQFPLDVPRGEVFFWMGKLEGLRGDRQAAIRPLRLAVELGLGAPFEAEARWLLAEAYRLTNDREAFRAALVALVRSGLTGRWREKAVAALKKLSQQ